MKGRTMNKRHIAAGLAAALALTLGLTGCGSANPAPTNTGTGAQPGSTTPGSGGTLTILTSSASMTLDPAKSWNLANTTLGLLYRRLTQWHIPADGSAPTVVPDLATDIGTPSDNGQTWTYHLKPGLKFSDGSPITSADVKFGIERTYTPELSGGIGYHKTLLAGWEGYKGPYDGAHLDSIETPDASTIIFHLNAPYGDWPWIVSTTSTAPVPVDKAPAATFGQSPITSGPYQVDSYQAGGQLVLSRNPNWDASTDTERTGLPDKIIFQQSQDRSVSAQKLITNAPTDQNTFSMDFVPPAQLAQAQQSAADRLVTSGAGALEYLALNMTSPKLQDLKVRQALNYAIDRQAFIMAAGGTLSADPGTTLITPGIAGYQAYDMYPAGTSGDVDKAKALLSDAGITSLDLTLIVTNDDTSVAKAQAIQQAYTRIGVNVTIKPMETDAWTEAATGDDATGYDLSLSSWQPDYPSAAGNIQPLYHSSQIGGGNYNISRYNSSDVDGLINQALASTDAATAQGLWFQADQTIMADAPVVPLVYDKNSFLHGSGVTGFYIGSFPAYPVYYALGVTA